MLLAKLILLFVLSFVVSCGNGKKSNNSTPVEQIIKSDLSSLESQDSSYLQKSTHSVVLNKYEQIFGLQKNSPITFVRNRMKVPFHDDQAHLIKIFDRKGMYSSVTLDQILNKEDDGGTRMATNYGTWIWTWGIDMQAELAIVKGNEIFSLNSPHVGLIGFSKNFIEKFTRSFVPAEARMSIYVHESRHSDCTDINDGFTCSYSHEECPSGHDFAGKEACDSRGWGAYSFSAIYASILKYRFNEFSQDYRILESIAADQFSRLSDQALQDLEEQEPRLDSK